ncbi:glycosyltransferase [Paenirhodobacter populi]|uniref:Glycosyltransferase n=1 Tax=Paenirhodobacter populi TaxID=2306993 RepID=A0A443JC14_9RHOB|nr:glycosyltransferase [Sinirhodobacter populi]RWR18042.1 glycosyltransferase [Sinirhodobacter populi]
MTSVDIGVFAHNEAGRIGPMLESLFDQDIFADPAQAPCLHILANGCRDATVAEARAVVAARGMAGTVRVHDLPEGGKSRTWNRFVHDLSRPEAGMLVFMDADIRIPDTYVLRGLVDFVAGREDLAGASSNAVKDISHDPALARGGLDRLIGAAGGTLNNWKGSICGQLYVLRAADARSFHMPIGLPVEDGFVRAMIQTRNFTTEGQPETRLDGRDDLFHVYESERGIGALIRHQTRIVIGSAINAVIYSRIRSESPSDRAADLARSAQDADWLPGLLRRSLPRAPYGYVPAEFLTKRLRFWARTPGRMKPKRLLVTAAGFAFDAVVYVRAQYAMWRGVGAGYW